MFNFLKLLNKLLKHGNNFFSRFNTFFYENYNKVLFYSKKNVYIYEFVKSASLSKKDIKISKAIRSLYLYTFSITSVFMIVLFF